MIIYNFRYYTEDSDREMDVWIVLQDTTNKYLTLVVTPYKVNLDFGLNILERNYVCNSDCLSILAVV